MSTPSLISGLTSPQNPPTIEESRRALEAMRSESLDDLRESLPRITTSQLLIMLMSGVVPLTEQEEALPQDRLHALVTASLLAITDEIDRRIPTRK